MSAAPRATQTAGVNIALDFAGPLIATLLCTLAASLVSGCSSLPSAGPMAHEVEHPRAGHKEAPAALAQYMVVDITPQVVKTLAKAGAMPPLPPRFISGAGPADSTIGVGDGVIVTIWEAGAGGLFTSVPTGQVASGARNVTVPEQVVDANGMISLPYGGEVHVAGLDVHDAEELIRQKYLHNALEPQVTISVPHVMSAAVSVTGEVTTGARIPLGPKPLRVLDVIAMAGGIHIPAIQAVVRVTREGQTISFPFVWMLDHPEFDLILRAGDIVSVVQQPKTMTAFGATGRNAIVPFEAVSLTLDEALAKVGGLSDDRADPSGVFIFRLTPAPIAAELADEATASNCAAAAAGSQTPAGVGDCAAIPRVAGAVPVVFRLDLASAGSYFLAREFDMQDKDILYVPNARTTKVGKFLGLVNAVISPVVTGAAVRNAVP